MPATRRTCERCKRRRVTRPVFLRAPERPTRRSSDYALMCSACERLLDDEMPALRAYHHLACDREASDALRARCETFVEADIAREQAQAA